MGKVIIGIVFVIGGLSGKLALRGTGSTTGIVVVGAVMIVWGVLQIGRRA